MLVDRYLLGLEHHLVLTEDRGHALAQLVRQTWFAQAVVAREGPEVVACLVRFGRHGVEHETVDAFAAIADAGIALIAARRHSARPSLGHTDIDTHGGGCFE